MDRGCEWNWETMWGWRVGSRELSSGTGLSSTRRGYSAQAGLSLELFPPAVSKEGDVPAAQPGSIQIAALEPWVLVLQLRLPESCAHGMHSRLSGWLPPGLSYQVNWETSKVMASRVCGVWLPSCSPFIPRRASGGSECSGSAFQEPATVWTLAVHQFSP